MSKSEYVLPSANSRGRRTGLLLPATVLGVVAVVLWPMRRPGLWSDDWNWYDQLASGHLGFGGPYYDVANHANPLPFEVQVNRIHFALFGANATALHTLDLLGVLLSLALFYAVLRRLGAGRWAAAAGTLLAGVAPAPLNAFTWVSASVHMWATCFALGSILCYLTWRRNRNVWLWIAFAALLGILAVWTKNDGVLAPVFVIVYELSANPKRHWKSSALVVAGATVIGALFLGWQATAQDPIREAASPSLASVLSNGADLVKFVFVPYSASQVREQFSTGRAIVGVLAALAVVGAAVVIGFLALLSLATRNGRVVLASGAISALPVLALDSAIVSRYAYPLTVCVAAAVALGLQLLVTVRFARSHFRPAIMAVAVVAFLTAAAVWGGLAHIKSSDGLAASSEADSLLAGIANSPADLSRGASIGLIASPLDANSATFRFMDPRLPPRLHSRNVTLGAGQMPHMTVRRQSDGVYVVVP